MKYESRKAELRDYLSLTITLIEDLYSKLQCLQGQISIKKTDLDMDVHYVRTRYVHEGLDFLTKELPRLGEFFDAVCQGKQVERVEGFKPYDGLYPCFLRPVWQLVTKFCQPVECQQHADIIRLVRTILTCWKKLRIPITRNEYFFKLGEWKATESELDDVSLQLTRSYPPRTTPYVQRVIDRVLCTYVPTNDRPHHGPGAVADGEKAEEKWNWKTKFLSLHREFPYYDWAWPVRSAVARGVSKMLQLSENAHKYRQLALCDEPTSRMTAVPKDSRGPRLISVEPKELMFVQQGVASHFVEFLNEHRMTKGHINFDDQSVNAELALTASETKEWATLDLKDASDRVTVALIKLLIPENIRKKWLALRSTHVLLPDGQKHRLNKYAPMGSAMCFPVESFLFWAISVGALLEAGLDMSASTDSVYVYGDDIIVADAYAPVVMEALESFGLLVNRNKSYFGDNPFRESCGTDALNGYIVTPIRIKTRSPLRLTDGNGIVAWLGYAQNFLGFAPITSRWIMEKLERMIGPIPRTSRPCAYLSLVDPPRAWWPSDYHKTKRAPGLQTTAVYVWSVRIRKRKTELGGWERLHRNLLVSFKEADPDVETDRQSVGLRKGWDLFVR